MHSVLKLGRQRLVNRAGCVIERVFLVIVGEDDLRGGQHQSRDMLWERTRTHQLGAHARGDQAGEAQARAQLEDPLARDVDLLCSDLVRKQDACVPDVAGVAVPRPGRWHWEGEEKWGRRAQGSAPREEGPGDAVCGRGREVVLWEAACQGQHGAIARVGKVGRAKRRLLAAKAGERRLAPSHVTLGSREGRRAVLARFEGAAVLGLRTGQDGKRAFARVTR